MGQLNNLRHERFCREYVIDFNGKQAAIRAGYSARSAAAQASTLLTNPNLVARVEELQQEQNARLTVTREMVIERWAQLAFQDPRRLFNEDGSLRPIHDLEDDIAPLVAGLEVVTVNRPGEDGRAGIVDHVAKIKMVDATKGLEALSKHFNIYEDHQKSGAGEMHVHIEGKDAQL